MPSTAVFRVNDRLTILPVLHGSGDCALMVRRWMLEHPYDCLAVPLPPSFQESVEAGVHALPAPSIVIQRSNALLEPTDEDLLDGNEASEWTDAAEEDDWEGVVREASYVPIDPCQPVIAALRVALGERRARAFIDLETDPFIATGMVHPDPYALKRVRPEAFAAALLASVPPPGDPQTNQRIAHMAARLRQLEQRHRQVLCLCNMLEWPWLRAAYLESKTGDEESVEVEPVEHYGVEERSLLFLFGELPLVTGLYERARIELDDDENLSVDGIKHLLFTARDAYLHEFGSRARRVTPLLLAQCVKYIRNLSLMERRMTPDLYTIAVASQQILGDPFARHVIEAAATYPYATSSNLPRIKLGVEACRMPDGEILGLTSRLPGNPMVWRQLKVQPKPIERDSARWRMSWDSRNQCSWPPEDQRIELFRTRVAERAAAIVGSDLARTEKFTTSVKDGIDIRDTLRHWYEGQIYVKILPPDRGPLDCCVMLFERQADPRHYPWRTTWFAEHEEESTLAFYATDFRREMVGPGIGLASYGGAMFLFPPRVIHDVWSDRRLDFADTLEDRLIAAAAMHARAPRIAFLAGSPPSLRIRRIAKHFGKHLIHVPMGGFSDAEIQQLRQVHVLNGVTVRSYAAEFIRKV